MTDLKRDCQEQLQAKQGEVQKHLYEISKRNNVAMAQMKKEFEAEATKAILKEKENVGPRTCVSFSSFLKHHTQQGVDRIAGKSCNCRSHSPGTEAAIRRERKVCSSYQKPG